MTNLGTVDRNGTTRFSNADINRCREFLRAAGLEVDKVEIWRGWSGNGKTGAICFDAGRWEAAYWADA